MSISQKRFFKKADHLFKQTDFLVDIYLAYWLAETIHQNQKRSIGENYFEHLKRVAWLIMSYGKCAHCLQIISALLHDSIEDYPLPRDLIKSLLSDQVDHAVRILSKKYSYYYENGEVESRQRISNGTYFDKISRSSFWIREIKIADRLDNISDMRSWSLKRKRKYLLETEKYILPIAENTNSPLSKKLMSKFKKLKKKLFLKN